MHLSLMLCSAFESCVMGSHSGILLFPSFQICGIFFLTFSCQGTVVYVAFVGKRVVEGSGQGLKDKHLSGPHWLPGPPEKPDRIPQLTQLSDSISKI